MSEPTRTPAQYAQAFTSWQRDTPVPTATETRLTLELAALRELSKVRRRVQAFLTASLGEGDDPLSVADEDVVEAAVLVIDELSSNALRHGRSPSSLHVCDEKDRWIVIVTDSAPDLVPTPARERPAGQGGYGLYVIADLTGAHGVHYEADRKMVWACVNKPG